MKIDKQGRIQLAGIYNADGKDKLYQAIRDNYGIDNPGQILSRMKQAAYLGYDSSLDKFLLDKSDRNNDTCEEHIFLDIETLCTNKKRDLYKHSDGVNKHKSMDALIQELIGDRLLTLSQYVTLDTTTKVLRLDETSLKQDGYHLILH